MVSTLSKNLEQARANVVAEVAFDVLKVTQDVDNERQRKLISRSFISDTITAPSKEMYAYAIRASLGDDVYEETSTQSLEQHIARLCGKEAALFVTSGTLSNQLAVRTHLTQPPYSVICDERSHTYAYEAGGASMHSGATVIPISASNGHHITLSDIKKKIILSDDIHFAPTRLIQLENTLNGTIFPQDDIIEISEYARSNGLKMHLDGARLWHVAAETGTSMKELCEPFDSISVCFSKGLGAPVGSCLVGSQEFIKKAKWFRKAFGAGMRQIGILSASAAFALTHNFPQLFRIHELARKLEAGLEEIGAEITSPAETCMVFYDPSPLGLSYDEIGERGAQLGEPLTLGGSRLVVHIQTEDKAIDDFLNLIRQLAEEKKAAGWVQPEKTESNGAKDIYVRRKPTRIA